MRKMFDLLPSNVQLYEHSFRWKMFFKGRQLISRRAWTYPFLDIGFHIISGGLLWDENWKTFKAAQVDLDVVFPLIQRPFMGLMVPTPHRPHTYLKLNFHADYMNLCASPRYNHRSEIFIHPYLIRTIHCEALWSLYPFVHRTRLADLGGSYLVNETLILNGTVISSLITQY